MIYIIVFTLSILSFRKYLSYDDNSLVSKFFLFLSAVLLLLLATFRSEEVGTDTLVYQSRYFYMAKSTNSLRSFVGLITTSNEILYLILTFIAAKLGSLNLLFFLCESIIIFFIYKSVLFFKNHIYAEVVLIVFLFYYYTNGFNIVRQSIAMSVILYGFCMLVDKQYLKSLVLYIIAIGFHRSAIIAITMVVLIMLAKSEISIIYEVLILIGVILLGINYDLIFEIAAEWFSFIPRRYISNAYLYKKIADVSFIGILYSGLALVSILIWRRKRIVEKVVIKNMTIETADPINTELLVREENICELVNSRFFVYTMIISLFGNIVSTRALFAGRIFMYFDYFGMLSYPFLIKDSSDRNKTVYWLFIILVMLFCFVYRVILGGYDGAYPFSFCVY